MFFILFQRVILLFFTELLYFPLWWYTGGVVFVFQLARRLTVLGLEVLSPAVWWRYLFVPMYGEYGWQGRIISFFMRFIQGVFRGALFLLWFLVVAAIVVLWFAAPFLIGRGLTQGLHR